MRSDFVWQEITWLICSFANVKAQMEYKNIDFNTDKVKQYEAVREAVNMHDELEDIFSFCVTMSFWLRDMWPKTGFASVPSSRIGCCYPKKLKIDRHQKAKLQEKQCAYFHDS